MELNIKFDEKMMVEVANRVLDEFEYKGRTIREWADKLAHPQTHADRIRAMTDEELAKLFVNGWYDGPIFACPVTEVECESAAPCDVCFLEWLKSPVEVDE